MDVTPQTTITNADPIVSLIQNSSLSYRLIGENQKGAGCPALIQLLKTVSSELLEKGEYRKDLYGHSFKKTDQTTRVICTLVHQKNGPTFLRQLYIDWASTTCSHLSTSNIEFSIYRLPSEWNLRELEEGDHWIESNIVVQ